jgi:UDP-N-acetylmuramyl pentapeptide phosphotransferase/UDP-N-acetylglucosamine-1-phosphate transferase
MSSRVARSASIGSVVTRAALGWIRRDPRIRELDRVNFRGRRVSLAGGPAVAAGATIGAAAGAPGVAVAVATLTAGTVSGAVGLYDDLVGNRPGHRAKGFKGHLGALREGRVTSGLAKVAGVGAAGLVASALIAADPARKRRGFLAGTADVLLGAGVIAGTANLLNLLDLRPGRALKAGFVIGLPLAGGGVAGGALGAGAAVFRADADEEIMLGDSGANALGAVLGVALAARTGPIGRALAFAALVSLTAASEKVSFTKVIQDTPWLRRIDELGRAHA